MTFPSNKSAPKEKWVKVDNKVTIVNGKLVYSKISKPSLNSEAELV